MWLAAITSSSNNYRSSNLIICFRRIGKYSLQMTVAGNLLKACFDVRLIYGLPSFLTHVVGSATVGFNNSWSLG